MNYYLLLSWYYYGILSMITIVLLLIYYYCAIIMLLFIFFKPKYGLSSTVFLFQKSNFVNRFMHFWDEKFNFAHQFGTTPDDSLDLVKVKKKIFFFRTKIEELLCDSV